MADADKEVDVGKGKDVADYYLRTLERIQKQYQQYLEVSELYKLPTQRKSKTLQYVDPTLDHPLTVNTLRIEQS